MGIASNLLQHYASSKLDHNQARSFDDDDEEGTPTVAKATAMCVLFLVSMTLGCVPIQLSRWFKWKEDPRGTLSVHLLLCFGGGVLMCTTFLHLLPEVTESLEDLQTDGVFPEVRFPLAELLMCMGFFTMYFVEECVHFYLRKRQKKDVEVLKRTLSVRRGENPIVEADNGGADKGDNNNNGHIHCAIPDTHDHSHGGHSHLVVEDSIVQSLRGLLIVLALSVHEVFEGLSVGLESSPATVWYMFGAVSAHKFVIAFCIGVELVAIGTRKMLAVVYVFTFAVVSPLGIGVGILVSGSSGSGTDVVSVLLQGLATGTLLYVVFFEILQADRKSGLLQWLAVLVGFAIMFLITLFTPDGGDDDS